METAILMAAGLGTRMAPLTYSIPKPLVKVFGVPMIETIISGLERRGVSHIYVVVGYKAEQFIPLTKKYPNLTLIQNNEYDSKNNISSIHAVCGLMRVSDCFICEADLYITDPAVFDVPLERSCYFGKKAAGYSDDWVFDLDDSGLITRVGRGGSDTYNMVGISYFKQQQASIIADAVDEAYKHEGHERLYWDEIVDRELDRLRLVVQPIKADQITEIDTIEELAAIDPAYLEFMGEHL